MKTLAFGIALLGATSLCSANDQGEMEMDTWCVTYVSTYLAPVANEGDRPTDESGEKSTADNSGRLPFVPSIWPTFAKNTSSVTQTTSSGLSFIGSDSSTLGIESSGLSLIGSDLPTSESQSSKDVSTSQELSSNAPTSDVESVISTSLAPTSSGIIEPQGRSIIFQVSIPNDNKRSINKRATGGFVGNDNPGKCTFAAVFNLAEGQLFESGMPIYYAAGEDYKELSGQDVPPSGSIKTTFAAGGDGLVFTNSGLPNGEAGFCQGPDGQVYITFTSGPPGCVVVNLAAYEATQCQNGRLVGVDDPSSVSTIATSEALESEASTIETLSTIESASSDSEDPSVPTSIVQSTETTPESSFVPPISKSSSIPRTTVTDSSTMKPSIEQSSSGYGSSELSSSTESDRSISTSSAALAESAETTETATSTVSTDVTPSADSTASTPSTTDIDESSSLLETSSTPGSSSEISGPSGSSTESPDTSIDSTDTTGDSTETTVSSIETTTEPLDTTAESAETTTDPPDTTTETVETTTEDACVAEITDPAGSPPLDDRKEQCSDLNVVTVSPSTVTVTETLNKRFVWVVPTSWPPTPTTKKRFARDDDDATTIFPTEFPEGYAAFCDDAEDYYSACSRLGVTRTTTTLPTPTETEQDPPCRVKQMVKRAGEAMGYEFEEHWELMTMPGYTMIAI
ncbi:hypothetical protein FHETE_7154 [Fusarium heterosporum]|uniref:DUF7908 domain-containing protein n=1 Tax=Fusarium heterosporum TaxID=42747 RepID=A0A8H5T6Y6_FUSHE|nr:hypothetical protein FHETE_7154 [Fusarium heterosporum]